MKIEISNFVSPGKIKCCSGVVEHVLWKNMLGNIFIDRMYGRLGCTTIYQKEI